MKSITIIALSILSNILLSCDSYVSSSGSDTYQETKLTLEEQEKQNPTNFLDNSGTYRKNLIGEWVLEGAVSNSASVATYKDVVLGIEFVSKTGTVIGSTEKTLYELISPNSSKTYKIKLNGPDGTSEIRMGVVSALPN